MNSRIFQLSALLAAFAFVATASACPKDSKGGKKKVATTLAAVKVTEDGRSDVKISVKTTVEKTTLNKSTKKGCCSSKKAATTVSAESKCASCPKCKSNPADCANCADCKGGAKTASAKASFGKKCGTKKSGAIVAANGVKRCPLTGKPIKVEDCPIGKKIDAVLASLPTMKYKIGEDVTGCSHSAAAMAKKSSTKIQFMIGDDVFPTETEASAKLVAAYEMEVNSLNSLQFAVGSDCFRCPMTAKGKAKDAGKKMAYRVAGFDFSEKSKAQETLKLIKESIAKVTMSYKVGDQKFCCNKMAGAKVKETGSTMSYIVGDDETTDEFVAKMSLAKAKIRTIVRTAAAAMGS